jgi:hypothetical protein
VAAGDGVSLASVTNLSAEPVDAVVVDGGEQRTLRLGPYGVQTFTHPQP